MVVVEVGMADGIRDIGTRVTTMAEVMGQVTGLVAVVVVVVTMATETRVTRDVVVAREEPKLEQKLIPTQTGEVLTKVKKMVTTTMHNQATGMLGSRLFNKQNIRHHK